MRPTVPQPQDSPRRSRRRVRPPAPVTESISVNEANETIVIEEPVLAPVKPKRRRLGWLVSWQLWCVLAVGAFGGVGFLSALMLFRPDALPNCPAIFLPLASGSMRLSCAQASANKQTIKDLRIAIGLVNDLPADHELRPEINRLIEQWSQDMLNLAERAFQEGRLEEATAAANQIPEYTKAHNSVAERVERWRTTWLKAEAIYQQAEAELRQGKLSRAFDKADKLRYVENDYWKVVRYEELYKQIQSLGEDGNRLSRARSLAKQGNLDNLLLAMQLVQKIKPESYVYDEAKKLVVVFGQQILDLAQTYLDTRNLSKALAVVQKIPPTANLQEEIKDFTNLAQAQSRAWQGTIADLEAAIAQAQKLSTGRPLYGKAQQFITRWQLETEGVGILDQARRAAQRGAISDLTAAIAIAEAVPQDNPRWGQVKQDIDRWTAQIQTIEDRPYLDQAIQAASPGDIASLQLGIETAKQIRPKRALYKEAQAKIQAWTEQSERIQDQPYLDQALALADGGDVPAAISMANRILPGRTLYGEAQAKLKTWQAGIQAQQDLQESYRLAGSGTPEALSAAIRAADRVPGSNAARIDAKEAINRWSQQLLELAQGQAQYDLGRAIGIAQRIPQSSQIYSAAQQQISIWQKTLPSPTASPTGN